MDITAHFQKVFYGSPTLEVSAAGRINLIGEHVDYCGGLVKPASLNRFCRGLAPPDGTHVDNGYASTLT